MMQDVLKPPSQLRLAPGQQQIYSSHHSKTFILFSVLLLLLFIFFSFSIDLQIFIFLLLHIGKTKD